MRGKYSAEPRRLGNDTSLHN